MIKKVLVPLDGSDVAEGVLPWVGTLLEHTGAVITLLRIVPLPQYELVDIESRLVDSMEKSTAAQAADYLKEVAGRLAKPGLEIRTEVRLARGSVAEAIVGFAEMADAELIAMSTHGRSGPSRWLLGSVAERVVRAAHCPVLVFRPTMANPPRG